MCEQVFQKLVTGGVLQAMLDQYDAQHGPWTKPQETKKQSAKSFVLLDTAFPFDRGGR